MVNFENLKILEKPENTIISSSICFVFNSKEFESIQKDSNLESVPRFQPFLIRPTLFFIFGKVKLIDSISGWSVTNLGPIHIKPEKAYGNETNWKIGFFLDLKSIIFQQKSFFTLVWKYGKALRKVRIKMIYVYVLWKMDIFLFKFWQKSENSLPKMTWPFQTEWIKLNDFLKLSVGFPIPFHPKNAQKQ